MRSDAVTREDQPWLRAVDELGLEAIRDTLLDRGVPTTQANGIVFWLADQRRGRRLLPGRTVANYRAALRQVGSPPAPPNGAMVGYLSSAAA